MEQRDTSYQCFRAGEDVVGLFIPFKSWQGFWPLVSPFCPIPKGVRQSQLFTQPFLSLFGCLMVEVLFFIFPSSFPNSFCLSIISICPLFFQSQDLEKLYITVLWSHCSRHHQTLPHLSFFHCFFWCFHNLTFLFIFHSYKSHNLYYRSLLQHVFTRIQN